MNDKLGKKVKASLPRPEDRNYQLVWDEQDKYYWVHCIDTGADAVVQDECGNPITELHLVHAWLRENFPNCDVLG